MKVVIITMLLTSAALANNEENFAMIKERVLANIEQRASLIQTHKSCVQGTTGPEQLKACRDTHKESMKKLKKEKSKKAKEAN